MRARLIAATMLMPVNLFPYVRHDESLGISSADELAEVAGRLCYKSWKRPNPATATNTGYIGNILDHQHFSVLEHASATFWLEGISRSLTHELIRHRHTSVSQVSQRYVDESTGEFVAHPCLDTRDSIELEEYIAAQRKIYSVMVERLIARGHDRKTARGAARGYLSNAVETQMIVTGNHRTWRELLVKRLDEHADEEIRLLAKAILWQLKALAPNIYQDM